MKYQIIEIWEPMGENIVRPCFQIAGQFHGYTTLEEARADKEKLPHPDHCIIIQVFE